MSGKAISKIASITVSLLLLLNSISGCTDRNIVQTTNSNSTNTSKNVIIRFMSNLPDRVAGQGKIEQFLADKYMIEHPEVKIEFETFQDVAFHQKFKIYIASNNIPDIYMTWISELSYLEKISAELNLQDFEGYGFTPGALETRMRNGKLYGIPLTNDMYLLYYNKALFDKFNIKVPKTYAELLQVTREFRAKGIIPCATNGKEKWIFSGMLTDLYYRINPDPMKHLANWDNASYEKDSAELKAAQYFKRLMDESFFQDNFSSTDYGTAKDLFTQGKAAMYYMGTWELGMATDPNLPESFKQNLAAMSFPAIGEEGHKVEVLANWYGGGYSVSKDSKVKEEAVDFLKFFFMPENWAQQVWDNGVCVAPQTLILAGSENELMKSVHNILSNTKKFHGEAPRQKSAGTFGSEIKDEVFQQLAVGILTPEQFVKTMDEGLRKGFEEEARNNNK
jgi:raffinose/stachyose/melibiose transport system substrate-binding protein